MNEFTHFWEGLDTKNWNYFVVHGTYKDPVQRISDYINLVRKVEKYKMKCVALREIWGKYVGTTNKVSQTTSLEGANCKYDHRFKD